MRKIRGCINYVLPLLILLLLLTCVPDYGYSNDNMIEMFSFKTSDGYYFCAEDGGGNIITADREEIGSWEKFHIINLGRGYVAIKSYNGYYLSASKDEKSILVEDTEIGKREIFKLIELDDNKIALKTYYDKYICAEDGGEGELVANRTRIGEWESFELIKSQEINLNDKCNLIAQIGDKSVTLAWSKPLNTKNIIGYNLYRSTSSGQQTNTPVTDFPIEGTSYTDKNIESNKTYYYILKAVYKDKTLGEASSEVSVVSSLGKTIVLQVGSKYMYVNGKRTRIDSGNGTQVIIKNGRTFLPIRAVIENMGGKVKWDQSDKKISIYLNNHEIYLWIGEKSAKVNGKNKETDVAPYISNSNRTMLPLRFIVENLDCEVDWDGLTKKVTIKTSY